MLTRKGGRCLRGKVLAGGTEFERQRMGLSGSNLEKSANHRLHKRPMGWAGHSAKVSTSLNRSEGSFRVGIFLARAKGALILPRDILPL